jgi:hypothetical protein
VTDVSPNGGTIAKRKQRPMSTRYGIALRFDVNPLLASSIARLSPKRGHKTAADVCRDALHFYCMQLDPAYQREWNEASDDA